MGGWQDSSRAEFQVMKEESLMPRRPCQIDAETVAPALVRLDALVLGWLPIQTAMPSFVQFLKIITKV